MRKLIEQLYFESNTSVKEIFVYYDFQSPLLKKKQMI